MLRGKYDVAEREMRCFNCLTRGIHRVYMQKNDNCLKTESIEKGVIRSCKSKRNIHYNGQMQMDKMTKIIYKTLHKKINIKQN